MPKLYVQFNKIQVLLTVCMLICVQAVSGQVIYKSKAPASIKVPLSENLILASNSIKAANQFSEITNPAKTRLNVENPKTLADFCLFAEKENLEEKVCDKTCGSTNTPKVSKIAEKKVQQESAKVKQEINPNDLNLFISF
ncbi:MAG: hypothetical protein ABI390_06790 [Daejeonella sp.]